MTDPKYPTEEELREQIAKVISRGQVERKDCECEEWRWGWAATCPDCTASKILSLIKQAGYVQLPKGIKSLTLPEWLKKHNYVQLDPDQSLPEDVKIKLGYSPDIDKGQRSLINNGWRKIIEYK